MSHFVALLVYAAVIGLWVAVLALSAARRRALDPTKGGRTSGVAALSLSLGVIFLVGESYFRWFYDFSQPFGPYVAQNWYERHDGGQWKFRGASADAVRAGRIAESDVPIIVLGDSVAWGAGVDPPQTFSSLLETSLGVPVLPAARSGWSTRVELNWLVHSSARPKALVLAYVFNDIQDVTPRILSSTSASWDAWQKTPHRRIPLFGQSYTIDWAIYRFRLAAAGESYRAWMLSSYRDEEAVALHLADLKRVAAWCAERGSKLVVPVFPIQCPGQAPQFADVERDFVAKLAAALPTARVIDLVDPLVAAGIADLRVYRANSVDGHPGPNAHAAVAELLAPILREALGGGK